MCIFVCVCAIDVAVVDEQSKLCFGKSIYLDVVMTLVGLSSLSVWAISKDGLNEGHVRRKCDCSSATIEQYGKN
jgi:hypothetical protein